MEAFRSGRGKLYPLQSEFQFVNRSDMEPKLLTLMPEMSTASHILVDEQVCNEIKKRWHYNYSNYFTCILSSLGRRSPGSLE